ncbi:MAG: protein translocase subunit SecD, partial [Candidatus Jacksonbacteria bacterium]
TNKSEENYRIIVELPGITDIKQAIAKIGDTPVLEFKEQAEPVPLTEEERQEREKYNKAQKEKAETVLSEVLDQSDEIFAEKAKNLSEDPGSKENGGDLDFANKGMFVPEFEEVLFEKLEDGQTYNQIVESAFGYHIIRRIESRCKNTKTDEIAECADDQPEIIQEARGRHILFIKQSLDLKAPLDQWKNTQLSGENLKKAAVVFDQQTGFPIVSLEFNSEGAKLFEDITGRNVEKQVAIFLDGAIISAPRVNEKISGGNAVITGNFTVTEARDLAKRLNAGALPVNINLVSQQQIGASLGYESVHKSFIAGIIGMIIVACFMIAYYRLPGLIASIALLIYSLIIITLFKLIPVVMTLSGVAGFILTIGMAVDANVLIFERLKEELKSGKTLQAAIDEGFSRAWASIRDSNISTLITAFILIWLGESMIKGFGVTLAIGILISMFTAIAVTRVLLKLVARQGRNGGWMWGI